MPGSGACRRFVIRRASATLQTWTSSPRRDSILVAVCILVSAAPYISGLGFHNDDWALLAAFQTAPQQDVWSLAGAAMIWSRPVQVLYSASLFWLFELDPLGYHLTNTVVLCTGAVLLNGLLRRLGVPPNHAFTLAVVWGTLPHAASGRFWYATFNLFSSLTLIFAATVFELRFLDHRRRVWRGLALVGILASGLLYEIGLPLVLLMPLLAVAYARRTGRRITSRDGLWFSLYPLVVAALVCWKALTTDRLEASTAGGFAEWFFRNLRTVFGVPDPQAVWGFNLWRAIDIAFLELGVELPGLALRTIPAVPWPGLAATALVCIIVLTRLGLAGGRQEHPARLGAVYLLAGAGIFAAGWAIFLGSASIQLTPTGIGNRTAGAASIGVALVFVGVAQLIAAALRGRERAVFAVVSTVLVASGTLLVQRISLDWIRAWQIEREVLAQIQTRFPYGLTDRVLLLDGVCQYVGPATVFEASWDLQWALQTMYRDRAIRAEVVTSNLEVRDTDIRTTMYGEERLYRYGAVQVFRPADGIVRALDSRSQAEQYFAEWNVDRDGGCPSGRIGHGYDLLDDDGDPVEYSHGFYPAERAPTGMEWRWMAGVGVVHLRRGAQPMTLRIRGRLPDEAGRSTLTILLNGRVLDVLSSRIVDLRYDLPAEESPMPGATSELRLRASRTFVPHEVDAASPDRRSLGFLLEELVWQPRVPAGAGSHGTR